MLDGFTQVVEDLKTEVKDAATELERRPPALVRAAMSEQGAAPPASTGGVPSSPPSRKGVVFSALGFAIGDFEQGLARALADVHLDATTRFDLQNPQHWARLGVKDLKDFAEKTRKSFTQDPGHAVTPESGVGNFFEIVGWDLPDTKLLVETTFYLHRDDVHAAAGVKGALRNGLGDPVMLTSRFDSPLLTMENTHIVLVRGSGGDVHGGKFVDRLPYQTNSQDQALGVFGELKGITASQELTAQLTKLRSRFLAAMQVEGAQAFIEGTVNGERQRLPMAQFVFLSDPQKAGMGRVGVRAAAVDNPPSDVRVHVDSSGNPYVRLAVVCRTDFVRRVYLRLFNELGL